MHDKRNVQTEAADSHAPGEENQRSFANDGKQFAAESLKDAEKLYGDTMKQVIALARKHPLETLAIGFGVGCLVGLVLARRSSS